MELLASGYPSFGTQGVHTSGRGPDFPIKDGYRIIQVTPSGSACLIILGDGLTAAGVHVTGPFHDATGAFHQAGDSGRVMGTPPQRAGYRSFAAFTAPDGNRWFTPPLLRHHGQDEPGQGQRGQHEDLP